ncbi:MAG TPA: ABC transporter substrate-binding protein [Oligoflexus sp.]|uniref:ABC transporter substrate-binding protein n=1 Tax=Oligoflexus sp. TaxID=1971216 RepID=UPI002D7F951D|nr:ABC transporter substrate-binding protein [Oligoflexus sp.]HET9240223.1 ABC transporter substrate-binding protein [Oligoflexus sp.]
MVIEKGGPRLKISLRQVLIPLALASAALQNACTCEAPQRLRLGIMQNPACQPLLLAARYNFFEQERLQVEIKTFITRAEAAQAAETQTFDLLCLNLAELLVLPQDYKILLIPAYSNGADVLIARSDAGDSLNDLKGARIGVPPVSMGDLVLARALSQQTLEREDFTVLPEEAQDLQVALQKSEIQLAVAAPPYSLDILKNPEMRILFRSSEIPGEIIDTITVRADRLQTSPELLPKMERVWRQTLQFMQNEPDEALGFLETTSKIPRATFQTDYKFLTADEQQEYLKPEGRIFHLIDALHTTLLQSGSIKTPRAASTFLIIPTNK